MYSNNQTPSLNDAQQYIGEGAPLWLELCSYIENIYHIQPKMTYSRCSAQPGWNVKYHKGNKSLCTLYPMNGYFIALVVVGMKEEQEVELSLDMFTPYIANLYKNTRFSCGGRWLMINVKDEKVVQDVKRIISIRVKPKKNIMK